MECKPIPDGWEECAPSEATQVWLSVAGDKLPVVRNLDHDMSVRINGNWVYEQSWPALGIIPIRKKKVEPVEFVVTDELMAVLASGPLCGVPSRVRAGMRLREVVEDE